MWTFDNECELPSLKPTAKAPENRPFAPKGQDRLPTIHFQVLLPRNLTWNLQMMVSKTNLLNVSNPKGTVAHNGSDLMSSHQKAIGFM